MQTSTLAITDRHPESEIQVKLQLQLDDQVTMSGVSEGPENLDTMGNRPA